MTQVINMLAQPSWRFLVALAAAKHGVAPREIHGAHRSDKVCRARWEAMYLIYRHTGASMTLIGKWLDKDHTSVLHGLRKYPDYSKFHCLSVLPVITEPDAEAATPPPVVEPSRPARTALQRAVLRAYRHQVPSNVVAHELGCSAGSVSVLACRMGIKRSDFIRPRKSKLNWEVRA